MKMIDVFNKEDASALIFILISLLVLTVLAAATLSRSISEGLVARRQAFSTQAFWLAEAGVQKAVQDLRAESWTGWTTVDANTRTLAQGLETGSFEVTVVTSGNDATASSTGTVSNVSRTVEVTLAREINPLFGYAIFGTDSIRITGGGDTDSYNSDDGTYAATRGTNGDVATSSTAEGAITLSGGSQVDGDAYTGPGGTVIGEEAVTGEIDDNITEEKEAIEPDSSITSLPDLGNYDLRPGRTDTISEDFHYSTMDIQGTLYISGDVTLYLTGGRDANTMQVVGGASIVILEGSKLTIYLDDDAELNLSGNGIINNTGTPENCIIYSSYVTTGTKAGITINSNSAFYGVLYAPDADLDYSGQSDIYGAIVGRNVRATGGGSIHYDEALSDIGGTPGDYSIRSWYEQSNPYVLTP